MPPRILLVDDADEVRTSLARLLARNYTVETAKDAEEAVEIFERRGPFAVVVSDYRLPRQDGIALLNELDQHDTCMVGVILTGILDLDVAISAVHEPGVYRFLKKPCGYERLVETIDAALARHAELLAEAQERERLEFSVTSHEYFGELLESRIGDQTSALRELHAFAVELCAAGSIEEIAERAALASHRVLGGRGVHVQVWDDEAHRVAIEASAGPEMSARMHQEPLSTRDGKIGEIVVDLASSRDGALDPAERSLLASIASATAVAAHHEFRRRERDHAQHATILALARLAEQRDNETGQHLDRVAAYCRLIADGLLADGLHHDVLTDEWIHDLERSSALHDIGKVGIPDSILLKPGKLSPEEWEIMKTHADVGAQTLDSVIRQFGMQGFLTIGRDIAWCHHEKWDGSGYPRGLRGAAIPLSARILALADVYDALTSVRPYKDAWPHDEALSWIVDRAGAHFDPDVVAAFAKRAGAANEIRERLADRPEDLAAKSIEVPVRMR